MNLTSTAQPAINPGEPAGLVVWLTGLSSAGKTTIAEAVRARLVERRFKVELLDGDRVRKALSSDLGFTRADRDENVRRIGFVASLLARNGVLVIVAAISPFRAARNDALKTCGNSIEVYVNAPVSVCEQRDVKGLYHRARRGEIAHVSGVDLPYEAPANPYVECRTAQESIIESVAKVLRAIEGRLDAVSVR